MRTPGRYSTVVSGVESPWAYRLHAEDLVLVRPPKVLLAVERSETGSGSPQYSARSRILPSVMGRTHVGQRHPSSASRGWR